MADCEWEKIYEHAADGSAVSGSLVRLVLAVKLGADIQIRYFRPAGVRGIRRVEWHRTASSVTVAEADGGLLGGGRHIVSCAFTDIPDTGLSAGVGRTFLQPFATEWQVFNTTGRRQTVKFDKQTSAVISDSQDDLGIAWYARCLRTPSIWELLELLRG